MKVPCATHKILFLGLLMLALQANTAMADNVLYAPRQLKRHIATLLLPYKKDVRVSKRRLKRKRRSLRPRSRARTSTYPLVQGLSTVTNSTSRTFACAVGGTVDHSFASSLHRDIGQIVFERDAESLFNECNGVSGNLSTAIHTVLSRVSNSEGKSVYSFASTAAIEGSVVAPCTIQGVTTEGQIDATLSIVRDSSNGIPGGLISGTFSVHCDVNATQLEIVSCTWNSISLRDYGSLYNACTTVTVP